MKLGTRIYCIDAPAATRLGSLENTRIRFRATGVYKPGQFRGFIAPTSLKRFADPRTSASSQSDELASSPPIARAMAAPMRSAAASVSRSPTWA